MVRKSFPIDKRYLVAPGEPLVYGLEGAQLVFAPLRLALDLALTHSVQSFSGTWGEMRLRLPVHRLQKFEQDWKQDADPIPDDEAPPSETDRDYLVMTGEPGPCGMPAYLPPGVRETIGNIAGALGEMEFLCVATDREQEVVECLTRNGITCVRNDYLILCANGGLRHREYEELDTSEKSDTSENATECVSEDEGEVDPDEEGCKGE